MDNVSIKIKNINTKIKTLKDYKTKLITEIENLKTKVTNNKRQVRINSLLNEMELQDMIIEIFRDYIYEQNNGELLYKDIIKLTFENSKKNIKKIRAPSREELKMQIRDIVIDIDNYKNKINKLKNIDLEHNKNISIQVTSKSDTLMIKPNNSYNNDIDNINKKIEIYSLFYSKIKDIVKENTIIINKTRDIFNELNNLKDIYEKYKLNYNKILENNKNIKNKIISFNNNINITNNEINNKIKQFKEINTKIKLENNKINEEILEYKNKINDINNIINNSDNKDYITKINNYKSLKLKRNKNLQLINNFEQEKIEKNKKINYLKSKINIIKEYFIEENKDILDNEIYITNKNNNKIEIINNINKELKEIKSKEIDIIEKIENKEKSINYLNKKISVYNIYHNISELDKEEEYHNIIKKYNAEINNLIIAKSNLEKDIKLNESIINYYKNNNSEYSKIYSDINSNISEIKSITEIII